MGYIEIKYLRLVSVYLDGFSDLGNGVYKCRCPLCGDSVKNKRKKRGYFIQKNSNVFYKCHNCAVSQSLYTFLGHIAPSLQSDYKFEKYKSQHQQQVVFESAQVTNDDKTHCDFLKMGCLSVLNDNPGKEFLIQRKIPTKFFESLFYVEDAGGLVRRFEKYKDNKLGKNKGVVIPFYNEEKTLTHFQIRFLDGNVKYLTFEVNEGKKIWGLDRVDFSKPVYVTEGPFDAMFIENSLAVAGVSMLAESKYLQERCQGRQVFIFDNDFKTNKHVFLNLSKAIDENFKVVIFDRYFSGKDINDAVVNLGWSCEDVMMYLQKHTKAGLAAKLNLREFKQPT